MVTITKRLRQTLPSPEQQDNLDELRKRTRASLNRPFNFEPKTILSPWEAQSSDPTHGYFKPFSQVLPISLSAPEVKKELTDFSWRRVAVPLTLGLVALAAFLLWETVSTFSSYQAVVTPVPDPIQAKKSAATNTSQPTANGQIVPTDATLEPGGPYTGTGGSAPAPSQTSSSGSTLDPSLSNSTSVTSPSPSGSPSITSLSISTGILPSTNLIVPILP